MVEGLAIAILQHPGVLTAMSRIRSFLYRSPRFTLDCRMDFIHGDSVVLGTCLNLSESGLRGTFSQPVPVGSDGLLTLYHGEHKFEVQARIDAAREDETRIRFRFRSDKERLALGDLIKQLSLNSRP